MAQVIRYFTITEDSTVSRPVATMGGATIKFWVKVFYAKDLNPTNTEFENGKVVPAGIEPASSESESEILSIVLRNQ